MYDYNLDEIKIEFLLGYEKNERKLITIILLNYSVFETVSA